MGALNVLQWGTTLINHVLLLLVSRLCKCLILDVQNFRSCMCQRKIWCSVDEMFHIDQRIKLIIFLAFHRSYFLQMGKARFNKLFPSLCLLVPSLIVQYCVCPIWILSENMLLPWSSCMCQCRICCFFNEMVHIRSIAFHPCFLVSMRKARFNKLSSSSC